MTRHTDKQKLNHLIKKDYKHFDEVSMDDLLADFTTLIRHLKNNK